MSTIKRFRILPALMLCGFLSGCFDSDDNKLPDVPEPPAPPPTFAATSTFNVALNGSQQVPHNSSAQSASAIVELDESLMEIRASVDVSEIAGVNAIHIHDGDLGRNGEVAFAFAEASSTSWELPETEVTADLIEDLKAGEWYINVHTTDFPDGEVRGQIVNDTTVIVTFDLTGEQEVPAVQTSASGYAYASVDTSDYMVDMVVYTDGVEDASMAHIHTGRVGNNGDVLAALEQDADDASIWVAPAELAIDEATFNVLASGGHYVNVHTPANPGGELRGQILTDNFAIVTFGLSGAQEVPAADTMASGDGYALVNTDNFGLELVVVTEGVDDATMAHIHTGRVGTNGDVLVGLEQSAEDMGKWMTPAELNIDQATLDVLLSGGHYVNVHTPANPSGELRGQILTDNFVLAAFPLSGAQEVPAVDTMASGNGYALVNTNDFALELVVVTEGVDDATMAHIHTGRVGNNGGVLVGLEQSMDDLGTWMAPEGVLLDLPTFEVLANGGHYVNVHTPANTGGELRGQILTDNYALATFGLSGAQEVPAVDTMASGDGYALVNTNGYGLELVVVTEGVDDASMAHIHTGRIGNNGDVLVGLEQSMDDMGKWMTPADLAIDQATFEVLASGGHYVNVHTPANPGGELRGQILTNNYVLATFGLSGAQEVPAVDTMASGDGYALVNTNDFGLELVVVTEGVDDASMAHIHTGRIGNNGGVLVGLEQSMDDMGKWMAPADLAIDQATFDVLASGGHYVNVHTPANPGGELRGQILTNNYVLATFGLTGAQEVPAVDSMASGDGYALVNTHGYALELVVLTQGVDDATMAHIHTGRIGNNGGVLVGLEQSMDDMGKWMAPADLAIDQATFEILASGGHYVNVHTPANPGGELRGQILTENFVLLTFGLDGSQQVPANSSTATGDGYALVNTMGYGIELVAVTEGVDDATAAHIHTGVRGENGPVLVGLEQGADDAGVWMTPMDAAIDAAIFQVLASGGHYVNVHTPAFPDGEIRGQIE